MNDYRGTPLEVGDYVAVIPVGIRGMVTAKIVKFTAKEATLMYVRGPKLWEMRKGVCGPLIEVKSRPTDYIVKI